MVKGRSCWKDEAMIVIYLIGVLLVFLFITVTDQRNDIDWNLCLAFGWPIVLAFMLFLAILVIFGFGSRESDWM
jgi:hypothetical protein